MPRRSDPKLSLENDYVLRCVGVHPTHLPYVSVRRIHAGRDEFVTSTRAGRAKHRYALERFLRRSLEAVSGKRVVLEERDG